ncbi:MAG: type II toxin-antitoxin system prevent-host-death family antitoxin [Gemmatimonadales bacterium]
MARGWKLEDAKNQFSRVVQAALDEGPQVVTRRGEAAVVVLAFDQFRRLAAPKRSLVEFMRRSPLAKALAEAPLDLRRSRDEARDIEL